MCTHKVTLTHSSTPLLCWFYLIKVWAFGSWLCSVSNKEQYLWGPHSLKDSLVRGGPERVLGEHRQAKGQAIYHSPWNERTQISLSSSHLRFSSHLFLLASSFFFVPTLLPHIFFPPLCANPVGVGQYQFAGIACNSMEIGGAVWNRAPLTLGPWRFFCVWRGDLSGCGGRSRAP